MYNNIFTVNAVVDGAYVVDFVVDVGVVADVAECSWCSMRCL